jgi:hypothetical protein
LNIGVKKQKTKTQAHKQGAVNKYDLTVFIRLFQSSEICAFFQGHNSLLLHSLDLTAVPHPRFPVQGHVLSIGGDVLTASSPDMNAQSFQWIPGCHFVCPADQNTDFTYIINPTIVSVAPLKYSVIPSSADFLQASSIYSHKTYANP